MRRSWTPTGVLALIACLMFAAFTARCAEAQQAGRDSRAADAVRFDLPAQPLSQALQAFAHVTDLVVLAPAPLLEGRTSSALSGDYAPRDALERLLAGTGLRADFTGPDEAIIVAQPEGAASTPPAAAGSDPASAAPPTDGMSGNDEQRAYAATLQARMTDALCAQPATVPGSYRLVAQLRIDDKGTVVAVNLVASSGLASRDAAIVRALRRMRLDSAPPAGVPEPVTILLRPVGSGVHFRCPQPDERN
ncbi:secretin and TonB N-terminal domain-containing protein [Paraburkholderia kururiensis]|uniref:secretin and TonB N-terminal domain-containing protein n=1 Tax=Paraburkholderia kururiensis TaxID=984307 RepID=UPI00144A96B7|nr:secretin and TonB N-terminal domain-containing protein [Paraburkholderia kururiensis]